jgi:hypothetical protein
MELIYITLVEEMVACEIPSTVFEAYFPLDF